MLFLLFLLCEKIKKKRKIKERCEDDPKPLSLSHLNNGCKVMTSLLYFDAVRETQKREKKMVILYLKP